MNDLISRSALLEELSKGTIITDDLYGMGVGVCAHDGQQRFCDHQCPFCFPKDGDDDAYN